LKLLAIVRIPLERKAYETEEGFLSAHRVVTAAAGRLLDLQMRADEGSLRAREFTKYNEIMARIAEQERLGRPLKQLDLQVEEDQT
jgi:hypothetical protein